MFRFRPFSAADAPALREILRAAVLQLSPDSYTPEQLRAWAEDCGTNATWAANLAAACTLVADDGGVLHGFGSLRSDGQVTAIYVQPEFQRLGTGGAILQLLLREAMFRGLEALWADVPRTLPPFFERWGFEEDGPTEIIFGGVTLSGWRMVRDLPAQRS